jgi:hypothetical protein
MAGQDAVGFWSYVHADNEADDERITKLASRLVACYGLVTGRSLELFVDRDSITWGDAWRERIDNAVSGTTFFFPVITPRYFESSECRRELLRFVGEARRRGVQELLLPVYYVKVDELEHNPTDEVMGIVATRQWEDLKAARVVEETSAPYRTKLDRLARAVATISDELAIKPREQGDLATGEVVGRFEGEHGDGGGRPEGGEDGVPPTALARLVGELPEKLKSATAVLAEMTPQLNEASELVKDVTAEIANSDQAGGGQDRRTAILRDYSERLREPAAQIERSGQQYARLLIEANPDMLTLYSLAGSRQVDRAQIEGLSGAIRGLYASSKNQADSGNAFLAALSEHVRLSRSLQEPVARLRAGMLGVLDGVGVIKEWDGLASRFVPHEIQDAEVEQPAS